MILDYDGEFTAAGGKVLTNQSAEIQAKTKASANAKDYGAGEAVFPYVRVTGTADINKCTSITVAIQVADDTSGTNAVTLSTKTILQAALTKNSLHSMPQLAAGTSKKVLLAIVTVTGTPADGGGKIIVGLLPSSDARVADGVASL